MKLCQYSIGGGQPRLGVGLPGDRIGDLAGGLLGALKAATPAGSVADYRFPRTMEEMIADGDTGLAAARASDGWLKANAAKLGEPLVFDMASVHVHAPVTRPPKFFSVAINNKVMLSRCKRAPGAEENPHYFIKLHTTIVGPFDPVEIPPVGQVGSEIEVAIVIGKGGRHIPQDKALEHIFGFMTHNDVTAHEMRRATEWVIVNPGKPNEERLSYPGRYKNLEKSAPLGPWLVTRDEVPDPQNLQYRAWLNGSMCMEGSSADHMFTAAYLVSYLSKAHTLEPGDIISSGTVPAKDPWTFATIDFLKAGGHVEAEVVGLGKQKNEIKPVTW